MKKKLKTIGKILILLSLATLLSYIIYNYYYEKKDVDVINSYIEETSHIIEEEKTVVLLEETKKEIKKADIKYTAVLEIPSINLKRGVVDSTKNFNSINYAISVDKYSNYPNKAGNFILYAHSGNSNISYFKKLIDVEINDNVFVYYEGIKYNYKIFSKYNIEKTGKANVLSSNENKYITLITCNQKRKGYQVVLVGKLVEQHNY